MLLEGKQYGNRRDRATEFYLARRRNLGYATGFCSVYKGCQMRPFSPALFAMNEFRPYFKHGTLLIINNGFLTIVWAVSYHSYTGDLLVFFFSVCSRFLLSRFDQNDLGQITSQFHPHCHCILCGHVHCACYCSSCHDSMLMVDDHAENYWFAIVSCPPRGCFIVFVYFCSFYRAMHFSANARSWDRMSSVRLSVCNVGDLWSHRLEILETNCTDN